MGYYEKENFWIELKGKLLNFYKKENKIYLAKYEEHKFIEEKIIFDKCETLNSVILSSDGDISLIYINLKGELFLSNFIEDKLENGVILTRAVSKNNYMQIASVNNSLNIFYINEVNTISTICFRVLSNRLTLTPAVIIDGIDAKRDTPYIISASDKGLYICYVKIGYPNAIGYRSYDIKRNSWSSFKELDQCSFPINSFDFVVKGDTIAYAYTFANYRRANIVCGIGKENIKNNTIQEAEPKIRLSDIYISEDNKLYLAYLLNDVLKIKELEINREVRSIEDMKLKNITYYNKYSFSCDKKISKNSILFIKTDDLNIYTDSNFVKNVAIEKYKSTMTFPGLINNSIITEEDLDESISSLNLGEGTINKDCIKPFISKIKGYEVAINNLTERFMIADDEKKKLMENINYLNTQLNQKDYQISTLQKALTENKIYSGEYENKVNELTRMLNNKEKKVDDPEVIRLREFVNKNEVEKNNYINIIKEKDEELRSVNEKLKTKISEVQNLIQENTEIINNSKDEISNLNNKILSLMEEVNNFSKEKMSYLNDIGRLKDNINTLNEIIASNNNEINILKEQISSLDERNNNDSFIKKLFKTGE
ncbi:hypothetical protein [Clostridium sp. D53t1_180928_C8]|uniref:hypothetical protein n=1 Tax=Clostridium sp. D53t1_180928_C8 TaxID=2787101 RepID=UPI0018A9B9D6|nr:hypothetical protein [Clostridium sp. D53t1_180928_C8]